jgi:DNA-binding MarR family transcriptional regulator
MEPQGPSHALTGLPAAASRFVRALEANQSRIARDAGVTDSELRALFHIARVVSVTPKDLATFMMMTTGAITAISRGLVEADLVHRVDHPADRRSLYLELTPHGHDLMRSLHRDFDEMLTASTSTLTPSQLEEFTAALVTAADGVWTRVDRP